MAEASGNLEFERAARLRDDLGALRRAMEKQAVVLGDGTDADVVAFAHDELRGRRPGLPRPRRPGPRPARLDRRQGQRRSSSASWSSSSCCRSTAASEDARRDVPREVLVPELPEDAEALAELLSELRGSRVSLRVPQRGDKRALMETVERNAKEALRAVQAAPGQRPDRPLAGAGGAAGGARPARRPACGSSASTSATCRAPTWWPAWWCSRTAWPARASTGGSPSQSGTDDTDCDRRGDPAPVRPPPAGARPPSGRGAPDWQSGAEAKAGRAVRLPAATWWWSTAAPRRSRPRRPSLAELGITDVTLVRAGQAAGGGVAARRGLPGDPAAHLRGAVPAAAGPRRGAPVRDHLPPAEAVQVDDRVRAGRRPRARRRPGARRC